MNGRLRDILIILVAIPVLGLLMGGVYSAPPMRATNCREPWYTLLLGVGLSITVLAIGFASQLEWFWIAGAWICSCVLLLVRRSFGKLDHNLERFGLIHVFAMTGMILLACLTR
jgi:hypothetical protein